MDILYNIKKYSIIVIVFTLVFYYNIYFAYLLFSMVIISYLIYYIFFDLHLEIYEIAPFSIICFLVLFVYIGGWYSYLKININILSTIGIFIFLIFIILMYRKNKKYLSGENYILLLLNNKSHLLITIFIFSIPFLSLYKLLFTHDYFMGYDPYRNEPLLNLIINNSLDPYYLLKERGIIHSGFYYSILAVTNMFGISVYDISRYGWIIIFSLLLVILYLMMLNVKKSKFFIFVPLFFFINDFVLNRFVMTIRENLAFLFLVFLIYILNKNMMSTFEGKILTGLIIGSIMVINPLTYIYTIMIFIFYIVMNKKYLKEGIYVVILSILMQIPYLYPILLWGTSMFTLYIQQYLNLPVSLPFWLDESSLTFSWYRTIYISDFSIYNIILAPLGLYYIFINKKYRNNLLYVVLPIVLCTCIISIISSLNFNFTSARFIIYIAFLLCIMSGITIVDLYLPLIYRIVKKVGKNKNLMVYMIIFFTLIIPITYIENRLLFNYYKWSPYSKEQVENAIDYYYKSYSNNNTRIMAPPNDMGLLEYIGLEPLYAQRDDIIKILKYNNIEKLSDLDYDILNTHKLHILVSKRWLNEYIYEYKLIKNLVETNNIIYDGKGIIVYECKIIN